MNNSSNFTKTRPVSKQAESGPKMGQLQVAGITEKTWETVEDEHTPIPKLYKKIWKVRNRNCLFQNKFVCTYHGLKSHLLCEYL